MSKIRIRVFTVPCLQARKDGHKNQTLFGSILKGLVAALLVGSIASTAGATSEDNSDPGKESSKSGSQAGCQQILSSAPSEQTSADIKFQAPAEVSRGSQMLSRRAPSKERVPKIQSIAPGVVSAGPDLAARESYSLRSFLVAGDDNLAVRHPFTIANAAEKIYSMLTSVKPRVSVDPIYRVKSTVVYPILAGEHEASGGRMVVGQEEALHSFVQFLGSIARGDRSGKAVGFPGPAGTGKTELLYVVANVEQTLGKQAQFKQFSYRFKNLDQIPFLRNLFRFVKDPKTNQVLANLRFIDPDMPRSPFTLLREDMQQYVLSEALPRIRSNWKNMTISTGWTKPEPKSSAILRAIFEHEFPEIAEGRISVDDLSEEAYLQVLEKYVVVVPKSLLRPKSEAQIIRAQTDDPNWQALFAAPNLSRMPFYQSSPLGVDYNGYIFRQDGGLLMFDELYRNPPSLLNVALEIVQNRIAQTDFGEPVELDVVPVWNANDESIALARGDQALKASLDRAEKNPMRLLLAPHQIESVALFQVNMGQFLMRRLDENDLRPFSFTEVYGAPDEQGRTRTSYKRFALYYKDNQNGRSILLSPLALNYVSWLASASRFVTEPSKLLELSSELNLVTANPSLFTDPLTRLRIILGDQSVQPGERMELARVKDLLHEGEEGISARDVETWLKTAINLAVEQGRSSLTPRMLDKVFGDLLDRGTIAPPKPELRGQWQNLRKRIKLDILLPELEEAVKAVISGDGERAQRVYDELEREFVELASNPEAREVLPDDGSQSLPINLPRIEKIRSIYRERFGRDFNPNFLLRNLRAAQRGDVVRDPALLEAVRVFLSQTDTMMADYVAAFDDFYRSKNSDPAIAQRVGQVESAIGQFGYDPESWRDAVRLVAQLRQENLSNVRRK